MIATVPRLVELIEESKALAPDHLAGLQALQNEFQETYPLSCELLKRGWLTDYQLEQIIKGSGPDLAMGPYMILEPIATGGMGQIYKARHQQNGTIVALKVIRQDRRSDKNALSRFRREVQAITQLSHPNIVKACDMAEVGVTHYYAMEYIDGVNLGQVIQRVGRLPIGPACDYIRQAALGLQHAHEQGLIHRDIKPENLLVTCPARVSGATPVPRMRQGHWGIVKVLDLGMVLLQSAAPPNPGESVLTKRGFSLGTVDYIAPEQSENPHGVDTRADLYSLGCTLYELLTGHVPFPTGSAVQRMVQHSTCEAPPIQAARPEVPDRMAAVVARLLAKDPGQRFQTPGALAAELAAILSHLDPDLVDLTWEPPPAAALGSVPEGEPVQAPPLAEPVEDRPRRLLPWVIAGIVIAVGAGVVAVLHL